MNEVGGMARKNTTRSYPAKEENVENATTTFRWDVSEGETSRPLLELLHLQGGGDGVKAQDIA